MAEFYDVSTDELPPERWVGRVIMYVDAATEEELSDRLLAYGKMAKFSGAGTVDARIVQNGPEVITISPDVITHEEEALHELLGQTVESVFRGYADANKQDQTMPSQGAVSGSITKLQKRANVVTLRDLLVAGTSLIHAQAQIGKPMHPFINAAIKHALPGNDIELLKQTSPSQAARWCSSLTQIKANVVGGDRTKTVQQLLNEMERGEPVEFALRARVTEYAQQFWTARNNVLAGLDNPEAQ